MIWLSALNIFGYKGCICTCSSDVRQLMSAGKTSRYAFPVPTGKIVDFQKDSSDVVGRPALYKINVRLK